MMSSKLCKILRPCFRLQWCFPNYAKFWGHVLDWRDVFHVRHNVWLPETKQRPVKFVKLVFCQFSGIFIASYKWVNHYRPYQWQQIQSMMRNLQFEFLFLFRLPTSFDIVWQCFNIEAFDYRYDNVLVLHHVCRCIKQYCQKFNNSSRFFQQSSKSDSTKKSAHLKQISYTIYNPSKQSQNP